ncbi:MAG: GNAT family N-acetyltransferase [Candidatus Thermoplasmatota archaeon]|nr:GNAT family N-acetyltransferase [Candidatus Thermoplasmatota archaeon]MBU1941949.1 GNAT family N-acetyltransferase [Candidatus Thermoplasmatota archaeon]
MVKLAVVKKPEEFPKLVPKQKFIDFLYHQLGEFGDSKKDITKAVEYAFSDVKGKGGFVIVALQNATLIGGAVVNDSGMSGYIPNHILVYIVVHAKYRGEGLGKTILKKVIDECPGDIALHVEYNNIPAMNLYENVGFNSKYAEMRYKQKKE